MSRTVCLLGISFAALAASAQTNPLTPEGIRSNSFHASADTGLKPVTPAPVNRPEFSPVMRGDIQMAQKHYREAIEYYRQVPGEDPVIVNKIGIAYHQLLDFHSAQKQYERAVKLRPNYSEAINNLGTIYYARKSYRRATSSYKKALRISPTSASILSNLGTAYFARKDYKNASRCYQEAMAIDPEVFEHRSSFGSILQEHSVEERAKFHYYLAKTYAHAGQNDRALQYLRKALEEGLKERDKMSSEPEFTALRQTQEFQDLLAYQPRVL